jgi:hypothetical protein
MPTHRQIQALLRQAALRTEAAFASPARRARRARRAGLAPWVAAFGLVAAERFVHRLAPAIWDATLPGGLAQAQAFRGPAGLLFRLMQTPAPPLAVALAAAAVAGLVLATIARLSWILRVLVWVGALGVILLNIGLLALTLQTAVAVMFGPGAQGP